VGCAVEGQLMIFCLANYAQFLVQYDTFNGTYRVYLGTGTVCTQVRYAGTRKSRLEPSSSPKCGFGLRSEWLALRAH
jgi:hypothetical protein